MGMCVIYGASSGVGSFFWSLRGLRGRRRVQSEIVLVVVQLTLNNRRCHDRLAIAGEAIGLHGPCGGQGRRIAGSP